MDLARKGKQFEQAYKWLYDLDKDKYTVTSPAYLYDPFAERKREIDVLVEFMDGDNIKRKMAIECRDRSHKQDVMWIEQLQQKKEDLSLDYILATTTADFTTSAIKKAKAHGVIIEKAEIFNANSLEGTLENEFFSDVFFFKLSFEYLYFVMDGNCVKPFKEFVKKLNFVEQVELMTSLNKDFYYAIEPHKYLKKANIENEIFFQNNKDNSVTITNKIVLKDSAPSIMLRKGVVALLFKIKIIPFRLSLPLNKSLSVFEVEEKRNKKFIAVFGNEDDNMEIGYIESKVYSDINLKKRKYFRLAGGRMNINTIFPGDRSELKINWDKIINEFLGEFDFSKII